MDVESSKVMIRLKSNLEGRGSSDHSGLCDSTRGVRILGFSLLILTVAISGCASLPTAPPAAAPAAPPPTSAAGAGGTTIVAIAPPAAPAGPPPNIFDFLGCNQLKREFCGAVDCAMNMLGNAFPGLMSGLPMSSLTNPAALASSNPAIAAAAGAKAEENAAPQKVAAIQYLGTLGCGGCHPEIEKALLAALDDCFEVVRFAGAEALAESSRNRCRYCTSNRCCSFKIRQRLEQIASERDENGCFKEPSARVRRMARVALCNCSCDPIDGMPTPLPTEGPSSGGDTPPPPAPSVPPELSYNGRAQENVPSRAMAQDGRSGRPADPQRESQLGSFSELTTKAKESIERSADRSRKSAEVIVNASDATSKPIAKSSSVTIVDSGQRTIPSGPSVRWERVAVLIYRFESKEDAIAAMQFIRQKALGEDPAPIKDPNMRYITTREVGWTRPQDIRSPEVARILFELDTGEVSPIIEVGDTLMICRVLEKSGTASVSYHLTPVKNETSSDVETESESDE